MTGGGFSDEGVTLLRRLGDLARQLDPAPEELRDVGYAAFAFRTPTGGLVPPQRPADVEVAVRSTEPSSTEPGNGGPTGSGTSRQSLFFFEVDDLVLDVELTTSGERCVVLGVVEADGPLDEIAVTVQTPGIERHDRLDEAGRFVCADLPATMVRIRLERPDHPARTTAWMDA